MIVAAGQPVAVGRIIRDIDGKQWAPPVPPTATASLNGGALVEAAVSGDDGVYAARVPGAMLSTLGTVVIAWAWEYEGDPYTATDVVQVTTVPVASLDDLDDLPSATARVPGRIGRRLAALSAATSAFEGAVNDTFSPRLRTETVRVTDGCVLELSGSRPTRLISASIGGDAVDPTALTVDPILNTARIIGWPDGTPVTVAYEHGMDRPPEDVTRAVAILASSISVKGPWDDRGYVVGDDGGMQRLLTAGVGRAMFSIPEVEACARRYRVPVIA